MLASIFSLNVIQTALELGCIYGLVALALFLSYSILNIADLSTDGCFTLGCAVACQVALTGHPILALFAAMAAGVCSGFVTAFLQTRLGVESIMAGIIVNTGLYTINLAVFPSAPPATTLPWCGPPASTRPSPSRWACASRAR